MRIYITLVSALPFLAALAPAAAAGAQVVRLPQRSREPALWASLSAGYLQMNSVWDGRTSSIWGFGDGVQGRASLEYAIGSGSSLGVVGSLARLPLRFAEGVSSSGGVTSATSVSDAHADVRSLHLGFHAGGGTGFHQVIQVSLGVTNFANFRRDDDDAKLGPSGDTDFSFAVGYGFGYSLGARLHVFVVQDYASSIHQDDNLPNDARRSTTQYTTRLGVRAGIGNRRTRI